MAVPTILEIKTQILDKKAEYESLNGLTSTSKTALYNLWAYVVAAVIWTLYSFFELLKEELLALIAAQKILGDVWYRDQALAYRHGHPLVKISEYKLGYSDVGYTDEEINDARIIKRAAVDEIEQDNRKFLFIKCAKEVDGELAKLSDAEKASVINYFGRLKASGTKLEVFSDDPDELRLTVDFYYDPLVLTALGERIDGTDNTPVQNAIREYLKNLRFNGEYSESELETILRAVSGCSDEEAHVELSEANYQTPENWTQINDIYKANSGYMVITDANLTINFKSKSQLT